MIEPTETESKETLDAFAEALARIAEEAKNTPELLHELRTTRLSGAWMKSKLPANLFCVILADRSFLTSDFPPRPPDLPNWRA